MRIAIVALVLAIPGAAAGQMTREVIEGPAIVGDRRRVGPSGPSVPVHVLGDPGTELHVRLHAHDVTAFGVTREVDDWSTVCTPVPCSAWLPSGVHSFALSVPGGVPRPAADLAFEPGLAYTLRVELVERGEERGIGVVLLLLLGIPGAIMLGASIADVSSRRGETEPWIPIVGGIGTAAGVAGVALAAWGDTRTVALVDPDDLR